MCCCPCSLCRLTHRTRLAPILLAVAAPGSSVSCLLGHTPGNKNQLPPCVCCGMRRFRAQGVVVLPSCWSHERLYPGRGLLAAPGRAFHGLARFSYPLPRKLAPDF